MPNFPDFRCHTEAMGLLTIVFGLVAMWIALGSGRWFVRVAVGLGFLALLVPIKAFQPIVFFSVTTAAAVVVLGGVQLFVPDRVIRRRLRRVTPPTRGRFEFWFGILVGTVVALFVISWAVREFWEFGFLESLLVFVLVTAAVLVASLVFGERFRLGNVVEERGDAKRWAFQLSDAMLAIVLLSALFALDSYSLAQSPIGLWREFGAIAGTLVLINVSTCMVVVSLRLRWRLLSLSVLLLTLGSTYFFDFGAGNWLMQLSVLGPTRGAPWGKIVTVYVVVLLCAAQAMRMSGWLQLEKSPAPYFESTVKLCRAILVVLSAVFAVCLLPIGFAMSQAIDQPDRITGDPAVFDALVEEANAVIELNPYGMRLDELRAAGASKKVMQITQSNAIIRQMVRHPFYAPEPVDGSIGADVVSGDLLAIRGWARIALAESNAALSNGQSSVAADWSTDCLLFGSGLSRGGHLVHTLAGIGVETGAHEILAKLRDDVPVDRLAALLDELKVVDGGRESTESLKRREHHNMVRGMGWRYRLAQAAPPHLSAQRSDEVRTIASPALEATEDAIRRRDATHRLLMTEIAIALFRERNDRLPTDIAELTPEFLLAVPIDPFSGKPLIYRIDDESSDGKGFIVYSTGTDGDDDGGEVGGVTTLYDDAYDYDVDTMFRPQNTTGFGGGGTM